MLTPTHIHRYGIETFRDRYSLEIEKLFSGEANDPEIESLEQADREFNGKYWDIVFAVGPPKLWTSRYKTTDSGREIKRKKFFVPLTTQIIVFKNKAGYDRYIADKVTIFNDNI